MFIVGGATYALNSGVKGALGIYPGWQHVLEQGLISDLHLSQTSDGITVTVEQAYADANQVLVGFSVTGLGDSVVRFDLPQTTLTDQRGVSLPFYQGTGVAGLSEALGVDLPRGEQAYILVFDSSVLDATTPQLDLRLVMRLNTLTPADGASETNGERPVSYVEKTIPDAFTFDFSVPFIIGRVMNSPQAVEAGGIVARLERVTVTPAETRTVVCFDPALDGPPQAYLNVGQAEPVPADIMSAEEPAPPGCYRMSFMRPLDGQPEEWTLTVPGRGATGPWAFRFPAP